MISFSDKKDTTIIVRGPSSVKVDGKASVFGCEIKEIQIPEDKTFPIYLEEDSTLFLSDGTFYIPVKGSTIPESWRKLVDKVQEFKSLFIYGPSDSGKSSLAAYLNNMIEGKKVLVDLDVGQSSIAHPGAMGIGVSEGKIVSISDVGMVDGEFVGTISPGGREVCCLNAVIDIKKKLRKVGEKAEKIIVDSTGWVRGRKAHEYKLAKLNILEPDAILAFENPAFFDFIDAEILKIEAFSATKRSRSTRMSFRSRKYAEFLVDAREIELDVRKLRSRSWNVFKGKALSDDDLAVLADILGDIVYAEKGDDFLNVFVEGRPEISKSVLRTLKEIYAVENLSIVPETEFIGLLVGLYSNSGRPGNHSDRYLGFGVVKDIDYRGILSILTSVSGKVSRIEFGDFRLDDNFKEHYVRFV